MMSSLNWRPLQLWRADFRLALKMKSMYTNHAKKQQSFSDYPDKHSMFKNHNLRGNNQNQTYTFSDQGSQLPRSQGLKLSRWNQQSTFKSTPRKRVAVEYPINYTDTDQCQDVASCVKNCNIENRGSRSRAFRVPRFMTSSRRGIKASDQWIHEQERVTDYHCLGISFNHHESGRDIVVVRQPKRARDNRFSKLCAPWTTRFGQVKNINENVPDMPRFAPFRYQFYKFSPTAHFNNTLPFTFLGSRNFGQPWIYLGQPSFKKSCQRLQQTTV